MGASDVVAAIGPTSACARLSILMAVLCAPVQPAQALPSFAIQTGQPCAACHVGAFGPQLKPYGRDFKLHGYVAADGQQHGLPLALTTQTSFTHTAASQPGGAAPNFGPNDNVALDDLSIYYAGKITSNVGAFIELSYDGVAQRASLNTADIRGVKENGELFGKELLLGITANNSPTISDPWNSTPAWGFPYNASPLAATPMAAAVIDNGLAQRVAGGGAYALWNDILYAEFDVYGGLDDRALDTIGQVPDDGAMVNGAVPYGRLALIQDWDHAHVEVGAYGLSAKLVPGGDQTFGFSTRANDIALDSTYQYIFDATKVTSDMISAHATFIHEDSTIDSGATSLFDSLHHSLNTFRADVSYSFAATVTPSVQYFTTSGTSDPLFWSTPNGSPNSSGMIFEVAYVPWGKPDSPFPNVNVRLAAQYVTYFTFDGMAANAHNNDNLYLSLWTAMKF
jgi:hypothetical protein